MERNVQGRIVQRFLPVWDEKSRDETSLAAKRPDTVTISQPQMRWIKFS